MESFQFVYEFDTPNKKQSIGSRMFTSNVAPSVVHEIFQSEHLHKQNPIEYLLNYKEYIDKNIIETRANSS